FPIFFATSGADPASHEPMIDDRTLVSRVLSGDMQAYVQLIKQHERLVGHKIRRLVKSEEDCEELCQDVFVRVYERLGEFTFRSKLSTWIAIIAYRHAIGHLRKGRLPRADIPDEHVFTKSLIEESNPETVAVQKDMDAFVLGLIEQLPPQYKVVLTLYHVNEMNYAEIGQITGMPEGTVKNYLFRARKLLKDKVSKH